MLIKSLVSFCYISNKSSKILLALTYGKSYITDSFGVLAHRL